MKKIEMISEIMNACKWCPTSTERNISRAMRTNTLDGVRAIYKAFEGDPEHALYYATILCA
jgi:hypothetical protein